MVIRATYVMFPVQDMQRACLFYEQTLGLRLIRRRDNAGWVEFEIGNLRLGLYASSGIETVPCRNAALRLEVRDIERTFADLRAKGVQIDGGIDYDEPYGVFTIQDPDGNLVDLAGVGEYEA